jgi:uncharacterized protein (DUF2252 family)
VPLNTGELEERIREEFRGYRESLQDDRRDLLSRYQIADIARKVVGVGSVGTKAYVVLLLGRGGDDPLLLQVKQATRSVLEPHLPPSRYTNQGERVIAGQRLLQATSDIFLGWNEGAGPTDYYWRQLRDMKGSVEVGLLSPERLQTYAAICGGLLARAHARSGDRITIAAYLGKSKRFDEAVTAFARLCCGRLGASRHLNNLRLDRPWESISRFREPKTCGGEGGIRTLDGIAPVAV